MNQHIIDAIATYICVKARTYDLFTKEVDTRPIVELFGATAEEADAALKRAKEILRDFLE